MSANDQSDSTNHPKYGFVFTNSNPPKRGGCLQVNNYQYPQQDQTDLPMQFQTYKSRIDTFLSWPKSMPIKKEELAHAGFIYTGMGDKVFCPWCELTLHQFESTDNACQEHIKHTKRCRYIDLTLPDDSTTLSRDLKTHPWNIHRKI